MSAKILPGLLVLATVAFPGQVLSAEGGWYLSPSISYSLADDSRPNDSGWGVGLAIGQRVSDAWSLEIGGRYLRMDGKDDEMASVGVDGLRFLSRDASFSPYAVLGLGYAREADSGDAKSNLMVNAGIGFLSRISENVDLRTEARYHWHSNEGNVYGSNNLGDWLVTFGANVALDK